MKELVEALYSRFLLRDVFGKIVPGTILLSGLLLGVFGFAALLNVLKQLPVPTWPLLYGAAWLGGFAIQQVPHVFGISHVYDKKAYKSLSAFNQALRGFRIRNRDNPIDQQQLERYIIIKESCGNAFWATAISPLIYIGLSLLGAGEENVPQGADVPHWRVVVLLSVLWLCVLFLLKRMHREALDQQTDYIKDRVIR